MAVAGRRHCGLPATVYYVAEDPDAYWEQLAPHAMHDAEPLILSPLVGGLHPDLAWQNLKLFEQEVFPNIGESADGVFR